MSTRDHAASSSIAASRETVDRLKLHELSVLHLMCASASYMAPAMSLFFATAVMASSVGLHQGAAFIVAALGIFCTASAIVQFSRKVPSVLVDVSAMGCMRFGRGLAVKRRGAARCSCWASGAM